MIFQMCQRILLHLFYRLFNQSMMYTCRLMYDAESYLKKKRKIIFMCSNQEKIYKSQNYFRPLISVTPPPPIQMQVSMFWIQKLIYINVYEIYFMMHLKKFTVKQIIDNGCLTCFINVVDVMIRFEHYLYAVDKFDWNDWPWQASWGPVDLQLMILTLYILLFSNCTMYWAISEIKSRQYFWK